MEQEIWKDVVGWEGFYQVSNLGRVKSLDRWYYSKKGTHVHAKERIVTHHLNHFGYPCVTLCKEKKSKEHSVHRLIMEAFVPNPENKEAYERNFRVFKNLYKSNAANYKLLNS